MKKKTEEKKEKRGGARAGAGRKPEGEQAKVTLSVRISERSRAYLERLAMDEGSSISAELERMVRNEMKWSD